MLIGEAGVPVQRGDGGVVAQSYPLFEHRTVLGNLLVAGRPGGPLRECRARKRAPALLKRFCLEDRAGQYPVQLSGGQQQRVAIAQQFMCSEHFLLMDEPFSGLDPIAVENVCRLVTEVANLHELNTIIVVTHDISAAIQVADTLWLLGRDRDAKGQIIPGARIQGTYNLIERGLAWRKGITTPEFSANADGRSRRGFHSCEIWPAAAAFDFVHARLINARSVAPARRDELAARGLEHRAQRLHLALDRVGG